MRFNWRLWFLICSLVCAACEVAHGQGVVTRPVEVSSGQQKYGTGWHKLSKCREVDAAQYGKTLADIASHLTTQSASVYWDSDLVTAAHECTHGINSNTRVQVGGKSNAFYCLDDWVCILREPNFRKSQVCAYVPSDLRGGVWSLYMAGQTEWDDRPLYILDEWIAYINGAIAGQELKAMGRTGNRVIDADIRHCVEFSGYASALMQAVDRLDPNYPDRERLEAFVAYNLKRTLALTSPPQFAAQVNKFAAYYAHGQQCQGGQCGALQWQNGWTQRVDVRQRPILGGTKVVIQPPKPTTKVTPLAPTGDGGWKPSAQPLVPVTPVQSCQCAGEITSLQATIAKLEARLESVSTTPGPAGNDEDDNAPPATIVPGEVDSTGLPWDGRIHSGKKTKTAAGAWRALKGVDVALVTAVEAELRALASPNVSAAPSPVPVGVTPAVAPVPPATPPSVAPTPPVAPVAAPTPPAAPAATATPPATPTTPTLDFGGLMQVVSNGMTANPVLIDDAFIAWLVGQLGVTQLPEIAADPAKIAQAYQLLVDHKRVVGL